jgi:hypothetical protein
MRPPKLVYVGVFLVLLIAAPAIPSRAASREEWGAPAVDVTHANGVWIIRGQKQLVTLKQSDLTLDVKAGPATWTMLPSSANELLVRTGGKEFGLRLADSQNIEIVPYDTGFKTGINIILSDWRNLPDSAPLPGLTLFLTIALEGKDEDLVFDIVADEHSAAVRRLDWPPALDARDVEYTVLSNARGTLVPSNWPKPYHPIRSFTPDPSKPTGDTSDVQSNVIECWSMAWWGFKKGPAAMMVIVETSDDAAYQFSHPAGGPTVIGPRWRGQLGRLGYLRTARMCFLPKGDYVDLAKRYRQYAIDTGLFVSLKEKIARTPVVAKLVGAPMARLGILTNIKPDSDRAKRAKSPDELRRLTTFDDRGKQLRQYKEAGFDRITAVVAGWPKIGYDRQHPDVLPPAPDAGGYDGMRRLAETCHELGYLFSLHDQYRDYYIDAPSFDKQFAIHEEDAKSPPTAFPGTRFGDWKEGSIPFMDHWEGGKMTYINGRFMLGHLKKNYQGLFDHGIHPSGNYLDVFGYVPPDEDFNPEHPTTRTECMNERAKCFNWSRTHLGFVGTEAGCDWTVPYVDITSSIKPKGPVPVPLYNLVYHDAIMIPYDVNDLHGFLNAGVPQMGSRNSQPPPLDRVRRMAALHKRLALVEMTRHEFLDGARRKERTTFADGTTVTVDWDAESAKIEPDLQ